MSVRVLNEVFRCSESTFGTRLVLFALADSASDDGIAWPTVESLCEKTRMVDSSVRRCVKELEQLGEIEVMKTRRGRSTVNVYRVIVGDISEPDLRRMPEWIAALFHPPKSGGSTGFTRRSATASPADLRDSLLVDEPSVNRKETLAPAEPAPSMSKAQRDAAWDALEEVYGAVAPHERSLRGKVARDLVIACQDQHGPDVGTDTIKAEISARARAYARAWPGAAFTETALHRRWSVFAPTVQQGSTPRERAKRWIDSAGWQLEPDDAELMLREFNLGDHYAGAVAYLDDVRLERRSAA